MAILSVADLEAMNLPIDLSGYTPQQLASLIDQAENWVNGEARHAQGFSAHRVIDRVYGTGTNKLKTTYYPICTLNSIAIIFPPNTGSNVNLPGPNQVPIDPSRVVIDHEAGMVYNWSPFVFQTIGYMTVFPEHVPINVDYYTGYVASQTMSTLAAGATLIPVNNASCFYWSQAIRLDDPVQSEWVTVQGTTTVAGVPLVVTNDPLQYSHPVSTTIGDMPVAIRQAVAFIICDMALRSLNPEDLQILKIDKVQKTYATKVRPVAGATGNSFIFEQEREFVKEARRMLEHFYSDRGIF